MRRAAKVDSNQAAIVAELRQVGASVQPLHAVGGGVPDLLVGFRGKSWLFEVKDFTAPPSQRALTDAQVQWHRQWRGQVAVIGDAETAIALMTGGVSNLNANHKEISN
jgi:hypothetical protein